MLGILERIKDHHVIILEYCVLLLQANERKVKTGLYTKMRSVLLAHLEGEEEVFYRSLAEEEVGENSEIHDGQDHELIRRFVSVLDLTPIESRAWQLCFEELHHVLMQHFKEEEEIAFVVAQSVWSQEEQYQLGKRFMDALSLVK